MKKEEIIQLKEEIIQLKEEIIKLKNKLDLSNCNRVEVIDEKGRSYVNWKKNNLVQISMQDENKTMKIFIKNKEVDKNTIINAQIGCVGGSCKS